MNDTVTNEELREQLKKSLDLLIKVYNKEEVELSYHDLASIELTLFK